MLPSSSSAQPRVDSSSGSCAILPTPSATPSPQNITTTAAASSPTIRVEPRYVRFPDVLYRLRHRYPTVTESVFLECTRCHQWVAAPVLRDIPDEIETATVAASAAGVDPIATRTSSSGPLQHVQQDGYRRTEQLAREAETVQWHSSRLAAQERRQTAPQCSDAPSHPEDSTAAVAAAEEEEAGPVPATFTQFLKKFRRSSRGHNGGAKATDATSPPPPRHPLLYIPNPHTFVCAGWQCAWGGDALADLRRYWLSSLYQAVPVPPLSEEALASASPGTSVPPSPSPSSSTFPAAPALSAAELRQQRRTALNEALAEELHVKRSRRLARAGVIAATAAAAARPFARPGDSESDDSSLPALSLPTQPLSGSSQADTVASTATTASSGTASTALTQAEMQLSRMQMAWVRAAAVHLLRNGGSSGSGSGSGTLDDEGRDEDGTRDAVVASPHHRSGGGSGGGGDAGYGPLLSAYCWAVCDACGKLRRVAQPFPGGAPFVCAMAVTSSSSCRAARKDATSSSSLPSSQGSSDAGGTAVRVENACTVSELDGLQQCGVLLCEAELIAAALSSPFLPYPLKSQLTTLHGARGEQGGGGSNSAEGLSRADVTRVLLAEPLLRTIRASVAEGIANSSSSSSATASPNSPTRRTPRTTSARASHGGGATTSPTAASGAAASEALFIERSLPILRELARTIKKRGTSALVRQLQLTPAQIQAKREAVLRSSFLEGEPSPTAGDRHGTKTTAEVKVEKEEEMDEREAKGETRAARKATPKPASPTSREGTAPSTPPPPPPPPTSTAALASAKSSRAKSGAAATDQRQQQQKKEEEENIPAVVVAVQEASPEVPKRKRGRPPKIRVPADAPPTTTTTATTAVVKRVKTEVKVEEKDEAEDEDAPFTTTATAKRRRGRRPRQATPPVETLTATRTPAHTAAAASARADEEDRPMSRRRTHSKRAPPPPSASAELAAPPVQKKKGRKPAKKLESDVESGSEDGDGDGDDDDWEVVHWVQCDRCSKWRIVPRRVPSNVKFWECKMRYDEEHGRATTCDDPDEADLSS